jgi:hypothetical protein
VVGVGGDRGALTKSYPSATTLGGSWTAEAVVTGTTEVGSIEVTPYALCAK